MNKIFIVISIILVSGILVSCTYYKAKDSENVSYGNYPDIKFEYNDEVNLSHDADGIEELKLLNGTGSINIKVDQSIQDVQVDVKKVVRGKDEEMAKSVSDKISIDIKNTGTAMVLDANINGKKKENLWKWIEEGNYKGNFSLRYTIRIPKHIKVFTLETKNGEINLSGVSGSFSLKTGVGSIVTKDIDVISKGIFCTDNGGIKFEASNINENAEVSLQSGTGSIYVRVPQKSKCRIETQDMMGKQSVLGDDSGALIKAKVDCGKVNVERY